MTRSLLDGYAIWVPSSFSFYSCTDHDSAWASLNCIRDFATNLCCTFYHPLLLEQVLVLMYTKLHKYLYTIGDSDPTPYTTQTLPQGKTPRCRLTPSFPLTSNTAFAEIVRTTPQFTSASPPPQESQSVTSTPSSRSQRRHVLREVLVPKL